MICQGNWAAQIKLIQIRLWLTGMMKEVWEGGGEEPFVGMDIWN